MKAHPAAALALMLLCVGARAQMPAGDAAQRWVSASGVNLRSAPSLDAAVVTRLALNTPLRLLATVEGGVFCEVQIAAAADAARGFTACRYLSAAPTEVAPLRQPTLPDGTPNPRYDPVRAFWIAPSWAGLEAYALHLNATRLPPAADAASIRQRIAFVRAPDAELNRMKAHLALGIHGPAPQPFVAWDDLQRRALSASPSPSDWPELAESLGLAAPLHNLTQSFDKAQAMAAAVMRSIALPSAAPSWFKQDSAVARLDDDSARLSGRFGIVHTYRTHARDNTDVDGLWDIGAVTVALTRPLLRHTLHRDGRIETAATQASRRISVWGGIDAPMCHDWTPGFAYGAAEPRLWNADKDRAALKPAHAPGSLLLLHTREPLPVASARRSEQRIALDRAASGFVRATQIHFDLDADGHADLVAWEGVGRGPGHLDGPTNSDDAWQRLFFINIGGRWFVLGHDSFSYGCGC